MSDRYEMIGRRYAATRREDGRIARRIHEALGEADSVVNVGVGHWAGNQHLLVETAGAEIRVRIATTPELMLRAARALELTGAEISVAPVAFARDQPSSVAPAHE